jgi:uncharacterized membrane protein YhhN
VSEDRTKFKERCMTPLITIAVATVCALIFGVRYAGHDTPNTLGAFVKTASAVLLAVYGWQTDAPGLIVFGLALGSVGDFALAREGERAFLAGMVAFALGHLAYALAFAQVVSFTPLVVPLLFWPVVALMVGLFVLTALWIAPKAGGLAWPVRAYTLVIAAMAMAAALLPDGPGHSIIQIGVAGFVASDLILALRLFIIKNPRIRLFAARLLWPLYWGGQLLILLGSYA